MNKLEITIISGRFNRSKRGWHSALSDDPQGRIYNLEKVKKDLITRYQNIFKPDFPYSPPPAYWSKYPWKKEMASYRYNVTGFGHFIVVNRIFDSKAVPLFVLEYLLFHELIHSIIEQKVKVKKMNFNPYPDHGVHFRWLMEKYENFQPAKEWLKENWYSLIGPKRKNKKDL